MRDFQRSSIFSGYRYVATALGIFCATVMLSVVGTAQAQIPGGKIYAEYNIHFAGFNMGIFKFQSSTNGARYVMKGSTEVSVLGGLLYKWRGKTSASGNYKGASVTPSKFSFRYADHKKSGSISMKFSEGLITSLKKRPSKPPHPHAIPVLRSQMNNVFDPFSALLAFTRKSGGSFKSACDKTIPVFDGKMRFNLQLSYKKSARINQSSSGGYSGRLTVCKVKYIPVAGHRPGKKEVKFMQENEGVEIWLMPLPHSRMYVPYQIVVPTPYGTGTLVSSYFQFKQYGRPKVALVQ